MGYGQVNILSYNCNGLADRKKRNTVFSWLKEKNYDIFCLQETHSTEADEAVWKNEWRGPIYFSHGQKNSKGVMILFKDTFDFQLCLKQSDEKGRWLALDITIQEENLCLINLYGPNSDEPTFFENIKEVLQDKDSEIVMVGDYNTSLNDLLDRKGKMV